MQLRRLACVVTLLGVGAPASALSQATKDQARLVFTVSGGVLIGRHLWFVGAQPVDFITPADTLALSRRIRSNISIVFGGTYFPGEHLALTVEAPLLGLGFEDQCGRLFSSCSADEAPACDSTQC